MVNERQIAKNTLTIKLCGIKFFYERTVRKYWPVLDLVRPKTETKLPEVLSEAEVRGVFRVMEKRKPRMCLIMTYACGLRISEAERLQIGDIDGDRMLVRVRQSKRNKDRDVPLPRPTLKLLREYWRQERPETWLFEAEDGNSPMKRATVYSTLKAAVTQVGIKKRVTPHTFRHSYATHLMERGVPLAVIQRLLGHRSSRTTFIYAHLTSKTKDSLQVAVDQLAAEL
jgi:site-specific recombinase XerD